MSYPDRPIRIVTSGAGGSADLVARVMARELSLSLQQEVTVDNRENGVIPINAVAEAPPDGYSLLVSGGALWMGPIMHGKRGRDVFRNFEPITLATTAPNILVVHPSLPVNSVTDLIALAESRPGQLLYSSGATGSSSHLAGELFKFMTGVNIVRAGDKDPGAIVEDLISGRVQFMFGTAAVIAPYLGSDRLRAIAVTSARQSTLTPGLPTVAASGLPGYESVTLIGFFAPAKTPTAIIDKLNQESVQILRRRDMRNEFLRARMDSAGNAPEEFADNIKSEIARWEKLLERVSEHQR